MATHWLVPVLLCMVTAAVLLGPKQMVDRAPDRATAPSVPVDDAVSARAPIATGSETLSADAAHTSESQHVALVQYIDDGEAATPDVMRYPVSSTFTPPPVDCDSFESTCDPDTPCQPRCELLPVPMGCNEQAPGCVKGILGVNEDVCRRLCREPTFRDSQIVPWEMFAYGEYIGPHRTPHVPEYRLRVDDRLEFVFYRSRRQSPVPYQIFVGDTIKISSATDSAIDQEQLIVLSDGTISLPLIGQVQAAGKTVMQLQATLNNLYLEYLNDPAVLVQIVSGNTPLNDVIDSIDATEGRGGQVREVLVSPDGTIQLPVIGSIPAVGLTLDEIRREVNARYRMKVTGLEITPILLQRAPRFIYVLGQVATPGRYELEAPTTVLQAIALAQGDLQGGNLRNIVILRRDENWRLTATRLDLAGPIHGRRPLPSDEIFLRDSDIVIVPRKPIQRLSEAVDLYFTRTLYGIYPATFIFNVDGPAIF